MKNVGFVTYNTVGQGNYPDGWHERDGFRAFLLQNSKGEKYAVENATGKDGWKSDDFRRSQYKGVVSEEVETLWGKLRTILPELDHLVVYVGASGSENAIAYAAELGADKVTIVACDCGLSQKERLLQQHDLLAATKVLCGCGGRRAMEALFEAYMNTGDFKAYLSQCAVVRQDTPWLGQ